MHHSYVDRYANQDTPVHRLDARAKLITAVVYTVVVISVPKYQPQLLAPYILVPAFWLAIGRIPLGFVAKHILVVSPFVVCLAAFNPIWDTQPQSFGDTMVRGGWLVSASIVVKFILGMAVLIGLSSTTRFADLLVAMQKLGVPRLLVMQLSFLYRYLFVLIDQSMHIRRARDARGGNFAPVGVRLKAVGGIIASLFIRTLDSAQRIHHAMLARGYDGQVRTLTRQQFAAVDAVFVLSVTAYVLGLRFLTGAGA